MQRRRPAVDAAACELRHGSSRSTGPTGVLFGLPKLGASGGVV